MIVAYQRYGNLSRLKTHAKIMVSGTAPGDENICCENILNYHTIHYFKTCRYTVHSSTVKSGILKGPTYLTFRVTKQIPKTYSTELMFRSSRTNNSDLSLVSIFLFSICRGTTTGNLFLMTLL